MSPETVSCHAPNSCECEWLREKLGVADGKIAALVAVVEESHAERDQLREQLAVAKAEISALQSDPARLDWLEANYHRINLIEPPDAFPPPADCWVLWGANEEAEVLGGGRTFRAAIDAAMQSSQPPTPDSSEPLKPNAETQG